MSKIIMGVLMQQRRDTATAVQSLLTEYGCFIRTRLGLHQASADACSEQGLLILEFIDGSEEEAKELEKALTKIDDTVVVRKMEF